MTKSQKIGIGAVVGLMFATIMLLLAFMSGQSQIASGSVQDGQGYQATTTDSSWVGSKPVKLGATMLGSVVITSSSTAAYLRIYDATTTDINKRIPPTATSSILIADFPVSSAAGTYTFDVQLKNGLLVDVSTAVPGIASSTITFK